ncbi:hypothetical protein Hdeb2414_s0025g00661661 [Helianthus debilis subsp. tardiflorus]
MRKSNGLNRGNTCNTTSVLMANKCKKNQSVENEVNNYEKVCYLYFNRTKRRPEYQIWD